MTKKPPKSKEKVHGEVHGLVKQEHGGALRTDGTPGHRGGKGQPPSKIREAARAAFSERLHILTGIVDNEDERTTDRIGALKLLSDTGGVDKIALTLDEQPETEMTPERVAEIWERLERIKTVKQREKLLIGAAKKQLGGGE